MNQPTFEASQEILLTDGTVMVQAYETGNWYRLTPDSSGSYINGNWSQLASMPSGYAPLYFASAVLPDGRVLLEGGEYNGGTTPTETNLGAIFDPVADTWTSVGAPPGWSEIGDGQSVVLPGGTKQFAAWFTHGVERGGDLRQAIYHCRHETEALDAVEVFFSRLIAAPSHVPASRVPQPQFA